MPDLLQELRTLRRDVSPTGQRRTAAALRAARDLPLRTARRLEQWHDELLFRAAFPASLGIHRLACAALDAMPRRTAALGARARRALEDTGIAGTTVTFHAPWAFARWLRRHHERAELVLDDDRQYEQLEPLVRAWMLPAEWDAFDSGRFGARQWIRMASREVGGPFQWLIPADGARDDATRARFEATDVQLRWQLDASPRSVSRNRVAGITPVVRRGFRKLPTDPVAFIGSACRGIRRLAPREVAPWLDASIAAIGARAREVTPTMDPNPDEVYLADLGEGAALCVIGAHPEQRLALEANYGWVLFANGVPIGYGGVTPLADQANTGINLFPAFRGSEAPFLFAQSLRVFRTLFGISRFIVNPYQFGADNDEALASGAFWFYDRLGFRSVRADVRRRADRERERLRHPAATPSSLATLRRLASADLVLTLADSPVPLFPEEALITLGTRVARAYSGYPASQRQRTAEADGFAHSGAPGRRGRLLLGPLLQLIAPDLRRWSRAEHAALEALVAAKGMKQERRFVQLSRRHAALWAALTCAARERQVRSRRAP